MATALGALSATSQTNTINSGNHARIGTITNAAFHVYEFQVLAGERVSAYMAVLTNTMTFEPSISLIGPDNAILATVSGTNGALIPWMQFTNGGRFSLICRDADGVGAGSYSVTLALNPRAFLPGPNLRLGYEDPGERSQIQSASFANGWAEGSDVDIYEFNAGAGDRVLAVVVPPGTTVYPVVTLHGPNGNDLATSDPQTGTLRYNSVDTAGKYYLACRDAKAYLLVLAINPAIAGETNALMLGVARCGFLEIGRSDNYEFTANAGDAISISMGNYFGSHTPFPSITHPIFPSVSLYGPDNSAIITKSTSNGVWIPTLILTNSGAYRLLCGDSNNNGEGIYSVTVAKYPGPNEAEPGEATTLVPGVERRGNVSGGDLDIYEFDAIEGDSVTLRLRALAGNPAYPAYPLSFFLIQADGSLVVEARVEYLAVGRHIPCLPRTGTYWVGVRYNGIGENDYSIVSYLWPGPPSSEAPDYLQVVNCGTDAILRWRTNAAGFRPQGTSALAQDPSATIWFDLAPPYPARDGFHFFTNAISSRFQAFRLIKP